MKKIIFIAIFIILSTIQYWYNEWKEINKNFIKNNNWISVYHTEKYWDKTYPLEWIDTNSYKFISGKYFKDKNWIYKIDWFQWKYNKINANIDSFKVYQDWYMQDDNCIFIWETCIKKWINKNIIIEYNNKITINYIWNKTIDITYEWYWDWTWWAAAFSTNSSLPINLNYKYNKGTYNFLYIIKFKDW